MKRLNESVYFTSRFTRRIARAATKKPFHFHLKRPAQKKFATGSNESCEPWKYVGLVPIIVPPQSIKHTRDVSRSISLKTMARHKFHTGLCCPGYYRLFSHTRS